MFGPDRKRPAIFNGSLCQALIGIIYLLLIGRARKNRVWHAVTCRITFTCGNRIANTAVILMRAGLVCLAHITQSFKSFNSFAVVAARNEPASHKLTSCNLTSKLACAVGSQSVNAFSSLFLCSLLSSLHCNLIILIMMIIIKTIQ